MSSGNATVFNTIPVRLPLAVGSGCLAYWFKIKTMSRLLLILFLLTTVSCSQPPQKISAQDFFGNPIRSAYRISPDGNTLSFLQEWNGHLNVFVEPTTGGTAIRLTSETVEDVQKMPQTEAQFDPIRRVTSQMECDVPPDYFWKGNRYIVFRKDNHGDENFHFYRVDATNTDPNAKPEDLTPFDGVRATLIDDLAGISDTDILIKLNHRDPKVFDACRVNVVNFDPKTIKTVVENRIGALNWITDHAGRIRAAITRDGTKTTLCTRPDEQSDFKPVCTTDFTESIGPQGYTFDNKSLYAISNINRDKAALVVLDPGTAKEIGDPLYVDAEFDMGKLEFSKKRKVPTYVTYLTWKTERKFFDEETKKLFDNLGRKLPGCLLSVTAHDEAEERFIVASSKDRMPGALYLFDSRKDRLKKLSDVAPSLKEEQLAPMQIVEYPNDGERIRGYLTLPLGRGTKNLPVVVHPHGGPWYRDAWGYDPEVQFLANQGYAVLQMNFRGSLGYGKHFWKAGFKEWGGKMQDDVDAGVKWLINGGTADPKRIAIYGESYGGYAALAGVTLKPELYAAAVDRAGISDLTTFLTNLPGYWESLLPELYAKVGNPRDDEQILAAHSPLLHVDQIKAPVFISHGRKDVRVSIDQSERMIDALQKRGLEPKYLPFDNEGHVFESEKARIEFHERMAAFLDKHLR